MDSNNTNNQGQKDPRKPVNIRFNFSWIYMILLIVIVWMFFNQGGANPQKIEWEDVKEQILAGDVKEITFIRNDYEGRVTIKPDRLEKYADKFGGKIPSKSPHFVFLVSASFNAEETFGELNDSLPESDRFRLVIENNNKIWGSVIEWLLFPLILILMWVFMFRGFNRNAGPGGPGGFFNVGKSTGKLAEKDSIKVTFKDVAGLDGAKEEVMEIVDFLKNPKKYTALGGKIPKGALLVGPPGTGKTLLAKAVAGEANVPFFSISGSDFVEMFVGVGASRVRDLFRQAKEKAPCIVFIDEIDAVGRARAKAAAMGGNDERENTLNQLLTEMDGFGSNSGVIILAATNRVDVLDKALLRAGRFDRQIHVDLPDLNERKEIFGVHLRPLKIDNTVDVDLLARQTPGFSGADIANVCNEAALIAARHSKKFVGKQDFLEAIDRIVGGLEKKTKITTEEERRGIANHEAGHATISWLLEYANPLIKVTIVPRGRALGAAWYLPEERQLTTKEQMLDEMCATLGGRAAEELFLGRISTGAMNDLERVTKQAYSMIAYFGMSDRLPNLCYYSNDEYSFNRPYSEKTAELIDEEVKAMVNEQYARAKKILSEHREGHQQLSQMLIDKEVIFAEDVEHIFGPRPWASRSEEIMAAVQTSKEMKQLAEEEAQKASQTEKDVEEQKQKALPGASEGEKKAQDSSEKKE